MNGITKNKKLLIIVLLLFLILERTALTQAHFPLTKKTIKKLTIFYISTNSVPFVQRNKENFEKTSNKVVVTDTKKIEEIVSILNTIVIKKERDYSYGGRIWFKVIIEFYDGKTQEFFIHVIGHVSFHKASGNIQAHNLDKLFNIAQKLHK